MQATTRIPDMLAPQYRDDAPKGPEDKSNKIAEGHESYRNSHMGGSDKPEIQVKLPFLESSYMPGPGKKEAHKDYSVNDQIETSGCTSWKKENQEESNVILRDVETLTSSQKMI